ncbi:MAG TPA: PAS domain-containing protein [Candidatus Cloacimonadota bacterium]|nr:PAS domain-containing protein [Candidatus Cloacimonadota bacterium]
MNSSFTGKVRFLIILLFIVLLVQAGIIIHLLHNSTDLQSLKIDIQNTLFITIFIQFIISMILIIFLPVFLHKAFTEIHNILKDITQGIYNIDIDLETYKKSVDKEFLALFASLQEMLKSILTFDKLKKDKIVEHHNRILAILNLTMDGFISLDMKGNIIYINDNVTEAFPSIAERQNMIEANFPPEVENNVKKYVHHILKSKTKQQPQQFFVPAMKRHIILNSAIIRDANGQAAGIIVSFSNLEKKKKDESE